MHAATQRMPRILIYYSYIYTNIYSDSSVCELDGGIMRRQSHSKHMWTWAWLPIAIHTHVNNSIISLNGALDVEPTGAEEQLLAKFVTVRVGRVVGRVARTTQNLICVSSDKIVLEKSINYIKQIHYL